MKPFRAHLLMRSSLLIRGLIGAAVFALGLALLWWSATSTRTGRNPAAPQPPEGTQMQHQQASLIEPEGSIVVFRHVFTPATWGYNSTDNLLSFHVDADTNGTPVTVHKQPFVSTATFVPVAAAAAMRLGGGGADPFRFVLNASPKISGGKMTFKPTHIEGDVPNETNSATPWAVLFIASVPAPAAAPAAAAAAAAA